MVKTYDTFLLGLYDSMLKDVESWYPAGATEWRWTKVRLRFLLNTRGSRFFTVDLVAAGKHFDQCLESGVYVPSSLPCLKARKGCAIPRLFEGMLKRVFSKSSGVIRPRCDTTAIVFLRQLYFAAKKVRMACDDSATYETVAEFFRIERDIRPPSLCWASDVLVPPDVHSSSLQLSDELEQGGTRGNQGTIDLGEVSAWPVETGCADTSTTLGANARSLLEVIQRVADTISSDLKWFEPSEISPKHGPGAVSDKSRESKYDFPYWPEKLDNLFPSESFAYYNEASVWIDQTDGGPHLSKGEPPSKLIAVPKTQKGPRLIASEPTSHQWIQQGIARLFIERMGETCLGNCISIRDQEPSRILALQASTHRDLATIDLSSASDRVSCWLVERIFRKNLGLLQMMHACRTRWIVNTIDKKSPKFSMLRKFTTMGSALTFPVQSYIYAVVCIGVDIWAESLRQPRGSREGILQTSAVGRVSNRQWRSMLNRSSRRIRVFGDDLIHPTHSTPLLCKVLSYLGLKVNVHKTFTASFFRESCGLDAYKGIEVTPCYVNEAPSETEAETLISLVESSNNFFRRGWWKTAQYIEKALPVWVRNNLAVKSLSSGAFGLVSFVGADVRHLKQRWNDQLHHWESIAAAPQAGKQRKRGIRGSAALLQYFTENPAPTIKWESGVVQRITLQLKRKGIPNNLFH
ncbi:MAG: putative replicase protein [Wruxavirus allofaecicola]|uniref:RNA-directed RNA polymerase n=1 Tax=Leviviridae sp. TaxID=2027243 RepID=A0ABY3SV04_9VIRU|nr:MAG: putative replicase protein [Leviviridae sp.]